jgi:hypothetical protein
VHSSTGDLILTAAHCLANGFPATFVPGFANAAAPSNVWTIDSVYLDPLWVASQDPRVDYAFARVSRRGGGSIEAEVGSALSLASAPPPGTEVGIIGYAVGIGGAPMGCVNSTAIKGVYPSFSCEGLVVGTSGAPWIRGTTVTGVTGGLHEGGCTPSVSYAAPFDDRTELCWPAPRRVGRARLHLLPSWVVASCRPAFELSYSRRKPPGKRSRLAIASSCANAESRDASASICRTTVPPRHARGLAPGTAGTDVCS